MKRSCWRPLYKLEAMQFHGKIRCISLEELTRGPDPIMTESNYKQLKHRKQITVVRPGKGLGHYALIEIATMPQRFQDKIKEKYGDMKDDILRDWFGSHFRIDSKAREFYTRFRFDNGSALPPEHINEYTVNASAIKAVVDVMADTVIMRKAMKGKPVIWNELAGAINYYREEFGHTLPLSVNRFKRKVNEFKAQGYESLISRKFRNQNRRKVTYDIESLICGLAAQAEHPYDTVVAEMYNQFVTGELEVYDPTTGEVFDPEEFKDKAGNPVVLSKSTIAGYLKQPRTRTLLAQVHQDQWSFNNSHRPYHLRNNPEFAFSKISADDRDLPRKMHDGNAVHAYYVGDVASGAIVGYAYSRKKDKDLYIDCMRNMFQTIDRNGWYMPAQIEVEHHLVNQFTDGLMRPGVVFPLIRWCNPGNSREKRQEHMNRSKKYGVEKRHQQNIGRWYAKLEANRTKVKKVYDENNNTYKEPTFSYDQLVADDIAMINEYNSQMHPNQKKYPGMTRWDVLCRCQNPDLKPWDKAVLYRFIGEHTETSIKQNAYLTVQYNQYRLSSPEIISRLEPRNYKVDAYWLADADGNIDEIYIYQNGRLIDTCQKVTRYNEATAEQTDADREAYTEQAKYVAQFDAMVKKNKIRRLGTTKKEVAAAIKDATAAPVIMRMPEADTDYSEYLNNVAATYSSSAINSI